SFRTSVAVRLDAENRATLYVPERFAHGYQTLEDDTEVAYQMNAAYAPDSSGGIHHADPALAIEWPLPVGLVSDRDRTLPTLAAAAVRSGRTRSTCSRRSRSPRRRRRPASGGSCSRRPAACTARVPTARRRSTRTRRSGR